MDSSGLDYIEVKDSNPFVLFKEWEDEYKKYSNDHMLFMNLATADKNGVPSNRTVLLEDIVDGKFRFFTTLNSQKVREIEENANVSICITTHYKHEGKNIARQVRAEGGVKQLSKEASRYMYDRKPLFCKIRSSLTNKYNQSDVVDWYELKEKHDELLKLYQEGKLDVSMPDTQIGFEITPVNVQFYSAYDFVIGDRVKFTKIGNNWEYVHLMA